MVPAEPPPAGIPPTRLGRATARLPVMPEPSPPARRGLFIAFEGGDGAGKSTQLTLLARALSAAGRRVVVTRQPGGTPLGAQLRDLVLHGGQVSPRAETLLFAADKAQHVHELVRPALERGEDVLTDRYTDSSIAYQGVGRDLGPDAVYRVLEWAVDGLFPDLTVVLDVPVNEGRGRLGAVPDRVEAEPDPFHERVRRHFLDRAEAYPERYLVLDATSPVEHLHARFVEALGSRRRAGMTVWDDVVGQEPAVETLTRAVADPGAMTHAWLLTGPPGSGRSVAARAFAAALECPDGGCGQCRECRTAVDATHADVTVLATEGLSIRVEQARDLVALAAHRPSVGAVAGDHHRGRRPADRAGRRLPAQGARGAGRAHRVDPLRALARGRHHHHPVPVAARAAAHPAAGGRGRLLVPHRGARRPRPRRTPPAPAPGPHRSCPGPRPRRGPPGRRRREVVAIPGRLTSLGACMAAAADLARAGQGDRPHALTSDQPTSARSPPTSDRCLRRGSSVAAPSARVPPLPSATWRSRRRHGPSGASSDVVDRGLMDLISVYRDVLSPSQLGARSPSWSTRSCAGDVRGPGQRRPRPSRASGPGSRPWFGGARADA